MKLKTFFVICLLGINSHILRGQGCDTIGIHTTPSEAINPQKPSAVNKFNWIVSPSFSKYWFYPGTGGGPPYTIYCPFYDTYAGLNYGGLIQGTNSDYYPEDGWELFKYNLGRLDDDTTLRVHAPVVPYIMLYNRYTGIMRLFAVLYDPLNEYKTVAIHVYELTPNSNGLNASAFLNLHGMLAQPLDQETSTTSIMLPTPFSNEQYRFFWADFTVGYDPCVCHYRSTINVDFSFIDSAHINLTGQLLPSKNVMSSTSTTFLTDLSDAASAITSTVSSIVTTGTVSFSNLASWTKLFQDFGLITATDAKYIGYVGNIGNSGQTLYSALTDSAENFKKTMGKTNSMMSSNPSATATNSASITSAVSTMKLSGSLYTQTAYAGSNFNFSTPGSEYSASNDEENDSDIEDPDHNKLPEYPAYDEILGTMALLQTPTVDYYDSSINVRYNDLSQNIKAVYKIASDPVYAFNPIMHADLTRTKVKVALYLRCLDGNAMVLPYSSCSGINFSPVGTSSNDYITPFVDVGCAQSLIANVLYNSGHDDYGHYYGVFGTDYELDMRFLVDFVSTDIGRNGEPCNSLLVLTYPVTINSVGTDPLNTPPANFADLTLVPIELSLSSALGFTQDSIVRGEDSINISAALTASTGKTALIVGGHCVKMGIGASAGVGVTLEIGEDFLCTSSVPPQTHSYVDSYCDGSVAGLTYNAYQASSKTGTPLPPNSINTYNSFNCTIYPNPAKNAATLSMNLPTNEQMSMDITDVTGKLIKTEFANRAFTAGPTQLEFDVSGLSTGMYFCKIYNQYMSQAVKLVIEDK